MRVKIYDYSGVRPDNSGTFDFLGECDLTEALPEPDEEQALAYQGLRDHGRHWIGGGAAPLILLERVDSVEEAAKVCPVFRHITGG